MVPERELETVELFHLQFLRALLTGGDKRAFVVKGGCNLRFFFGSPRLSEDLDLDVVFRSAVALRNRVDRLLESKGLETILAAHRIAIVRASAPKQTETVQRWKIALKSNAGAVATKVGFSAADPSRTRPSTRRIPASSRTTRFRRRSRCITPLPRRPARR